MSMSPTDFHDLLDSAVADAPVANHHQADVAAGRRRLRRRTWSVTAGAAALVAVTTVGAVSASSGDDADRGTDDSPSLVAQAPGTDADLLDSCRQGNQGSEDTAAIFGSGTPVVEVDSRTDLQVILAIEAADGRHWAECLIHLQDAEFASGMTVYDSSGRSTGTSYSSGPACGLADGEVDGSCSTFFVTWVDRVPAAVAAVRFELLGGTSTTVEAEDGYVVLNHLGGAPGGFDVTDMPRPIDRVIYLDARGDPIAAEALDGSGTGPDHDKIAGLPRLGAYPSLRDDYAESSTS